MNGTQQKNHSTALSELAGGLNEFASASLERMVEIEQSLTHAHQSVKFAHAEIARLETALNNERTHRLELADQQRSYVDRADMEVLDSLRRLRDRSFLSRLNWLITGR